MTKGEDKLAGVVRQAVEAFQPGFGVRLWDGEILSPAGYPSDGPFLVLNDPAAIARLFVKPTMATGLELWMSKAIDVEGGSLFDIAERRSSVRTRSGVKGLDKLRLAAAVPSLLSLARKGQRSAKAATTADAGASGSSKSAIQFHYDVSNDFYRLFLDERMVYSCGYFDGWHDDIEKAQTDKLEHICRKLRLGPGDRLLDIGCGWGALLIYAAETRGVVGHGVTLSQAQYDLAKARIVEKGLSDKITIELKPFQDLNGQFDKISSVGMFEHVGFANHDAYFASVRKLLRPGGLYLHHAIARPAKRSLKEFHKGSREYRALVRYIFPGGELDYLGHTAQKLEAHRFEIHDVENLRGHYGRTCRLWAERLRSNMVEASRLAGEERARLWLLYLTGCALAFERGTVMIYQTVASKRSRGGQGELPPTRRDLYR